jgi:hypothetical protein
MGQKSHSIEPHDLWLHRYLMQNSSWYSYCYRQGWNDLMGKMRDELIEKLNGRHG